HESSLILARDRFGEKPLYFGWSRHGFVFSSELISLDALPRFDNPFEPAAVRALLRYNNVPAPLSIYRDVFKLPSGCIARIDRSGIGSAATRWLDGDEDAGFRIDRYYDYSAVLLDGDRRPIANPIEARTAVRSALTTAVERQLVADVPVGTFLSGGIDSSIITGLASHATGPGALKSFSIGFDVAGFDEAVHARKVARHFGTDHHELYVNADDVLSTIPLLATIYNEPFADSSQIPTFLVARLAKRNVKVALSGDAGDELFGGYNRHRQFPKLWRRAAQLPKAVRRILLGGTALIPTTAWNLAADAIGRSRADHFGHTVRRALDAFSRAENFGGLIGSFLDGWDGKGDPVVTTSDRDWVVEPRLDLGLEHLSYGRRLMHADTIRYLPDDILCKVDRAAMAVSLETRVPFLDPELVATASRIPDSMLFGRDGGKQILRDVLFDLAPRSLFDRPKAGFAIPIGQWLRGPLRDWAEELLSPSRLNEDGLLNAPVIRARWQSHLEGREDAHQPIWAVLMWQSWKSTRANAVSIG
ncbi:MAG: asparagine synthetase B, partial [Sphingomonadaceae bacterium]|nr:asparagine synthetase B [Sphingomonadaceae bacterium]